MATVTKGKTFNSGEVVTPAKLHQMVDQASVSDIGDADISAGAVSASKLASVLDLSAKTVTLADNLVTAAKFRQSAALSVVGNATNATANVTDIAAATDGHVLRRSGTSVAFGTVSTDGIADRSVTAAKLSGVTSIDAKTAAYTLVAGDVGKFIEVNSAGALTVTVPSNASVAFATGTIIAVTRRGAGDVTIAAAAGVTLSSDSGRLKIGKQYAAVALLKIGTNEWMVLGNLKA